MSDNKSIIVNVNEERKVIDSIQLKIKEIICHEVRQLNRSDLFRTPIVSFSSAEDERYHKLKTVIGSWHLNPTELFSEAKSVISYFVPFTKEVAYAPKKAEQEAPLWGESYTIINESFELINQSVCDYLEAEGYLSYLIPATYTYDEKAMTAMWSHRSAAAIAGLGSFGANRMLITEKGSGGRFGTVLTSAVLNSTDKTFENKCLYIKDGSCGLCFKACPVHALKPDYIAKGVCQAETKINERLLATSAHLSNADACGKCISICPFAYIE